MLLGPNNHELTNIFKRNGTQEGQRIINRCDLVLLKLKMTNQIICHHCLLSQEVSPIFAWNWIILPVCPKIHSNYDITAWNKLDWEKIQLLFSSRVMDPSQVPLLQLHFQIIMQNSPSPWKSVPGSFKLMPHCPSQYCNARIQKTSSAYSRINIQRTETLSHVFLTNLWFWKLIYSLIL